MQDISPSATTRPVYIVFGATGGIGSALCRKLAARDAMVVAVARRTSRVVSLAHDVNGFSFSLDATHLDLVEDCFRDVLQKCGRIDGAANCIGSLLIKPAHLVTDLEWRETIALNLTTSFAVVRAAGKYMARGAGSGGSVVLMASAAAQIGLPNHEAIAAAKAGVIGMAQSAAATYAAQSLRFNCVAPGLVRTEMTAGITSKPAALEKSTSFHPLGRIGEPDEVASAIDWLLDHKQSWITGQVLGVDGGLAAAKTK